MGNKLNIQVIKPGLYSTIQDFGRPGYQAFGVPISGVMSKHSANRANWLVGNAPGSPVLELTMFGPTLKLSGRGQIALAGASAPSKLDGKTVPHLHTINLEGVHSLEIGAMASGCRCYLAIGGRWQISTWLDSFSAASVEPLRLTPQSLLRTQLEFQVQQQQFCDERILPSDPPDRSPINVLAGPEYNTLPTASIKDFLSRTFEISSQSNRMGYRLLGSLEDYQVQKEVISSGIVPGTIQITNNGELIVLMMDAQTSGGYPRLANVIHKDLDRLAQYKPGEKVKFKLISFKEINA